MPNLMGVNERAIELKQLQKLTKQDLELLEEIVFVFTKSTQPKKSVAVLLPYDVYEDMLFILKATRSLVASITPLSRKRIGGAA